MITLRKRYVYDKFQNVEDIQLDKKDYGISFCDLATECDIEGHEPERYRVLEGIKTDEQMQKCKVCRMVRSVKISLTSTQLNGLLFGGYAQEIEYGEWYNPECYECEESCIINKPMKPFKCPNCHQTHGENVDGIDGLIHSGSNETLLFDCGFCNERDQIID